MNVGNFIYSSKTLAEVKGQYILPDDFLKYYSKLDDIERKSLVYHYIMDNAPYAFNEVYKKPLLFEQVKQYIAHILDIDINHIKLIGSTKTGFRMGVNGYGSPYSKVSDLDFMIIDEKLFSRLVDEFNVWNAAYLEKGELVPNNIEKKYWDENISRILPRSISYGFIDTKFIPNRPNYFPINAKINNTMSNVTTRLKTSYGFSTKGSSVRVYKDIDCFYYQQCRNIEAILHKNGHNRK